MNKQQRMVLNFMRAVEQAVGAYPKLVDPPTHQLRIDLIQEELNEYASSSSIEDVADALADLLYVVYGAAVAHGIDMEPVFHEVHDANMRKIDGPVRADGKRLKSPNWTPPDIQRVLAEQMVYVEKE